MILGAYLRLVNVLKMFSAYSLPATYLCRLLWRSSFVTANLGNHDVITYR
jgi:hypothetical protein